MNCTKFYIRSVDGSYLRIGFGYRERIRFVKNKRKATIFDKENAVAAIKLFGGSIVPAMRRYVVLGADPKDPLMSIEWDEHMKVGILWKGKDRDRLFLVAKDMDSANVTIKMFASYKFPADGETLVPCKIREVKYASQP